VFNKHIKQLPFTFTMYKFQRKSVKKPRAQRRGPSRSITSFPVRGGNQVHERLNLTLSGAQVAAGYQIIIDPSSLILASRRTGYFAIYDDIRLDSLRIELAPSGSSAATGTWTFYIDRDPAAAIVATQILAADQFESVTGRQNQTLRYTWRPQQPSDLAFQDLTAGNVSLGSLNVIGTAAFGSNVCLVTTLTVRGRP